MSLNIHILEEKITKSVEAFNDLNDYEVRAKLLAEVVRSELMNMRGGNAHTKTRADVRGGGKKPWKQKGTGRARHGSTRSPLWVGGGVTFGPRNTVNWNRKINKSARVAALKSILKDRLIENSVYLFNSIDYPKTKSAVEILDVLSKATGNKAKNVVILYTSQDKNTLAGFVSSEAKLMNAANLKIINLVNSKNLILTPNAKELLEQKVSN